MEIETGGRSSAQRGSRQRQEAEVLHREEADNRQSDGDRKTGGRSSAQRGSRQQTK